MTRERLIWIAAVFVLAVVAALGWFRPGPVPLSRLTPAMPEQCTDEVVDKMLRESGFGEPTHDATPDCAIDYEKLAALLTEMDPTPGAKK